MRRHWLLNRRLLAAPVQQSAGGQTSCTGTIDLGTINPAARSRGLKLG
ncbi:MAG: hypothetical protein OEW48_07805 [Phycisphaerae bacterium]|nr:hypothetical protein [Phycisphaerae bacterium]